MAPINPEVRLERFLAGQGLTPAVRLEYFLAGAAGYGLAALQNESAAISAGGTAVATIQDAADSVPLQSLVVAVDLLQDGTGTPSTDNERPIVARESVTITQTDANDENPIDYTAKLPSGFYGGSVDVVKGAAVSAYASIILDGTETWRTGATNQGYYTSVDTLKHYSNYINAIKCDKLPAFSNNASEAYRTSDTGITGYYDNGGAYPNNNWIYLKVSGIGSTDALNEWLAENPIQVVYETVEQPEIKIDPVTILTLRGVNNISADTGNVLSLEYKQDPEASANEIKALIAPVLPEMKADTNLVANDFRIVGNTLYKITANIASGSTLTPGSNCTSTTVGEQLKALLNA